MWWLIAAILVGVLAAAVAVTPADVRDDALSECLIKQSASPTLRDEGYRLAEIVIFRTGTTPWSWKPIDRAVDAEFAARPMMTTHVDAPVEQSDRPVPLAHCLAVIDSPRVKAAMATILSRPSRR